MTWRTERLTKRAPKFTFGKLMRPQWHPPPKPDDYCYRTVDDHFVRISRRDGRPPCLPGTSVFHSARRCFARSFRAVDAFCSVLYRTLLRISSRAVRLPLLRLINATNS